MYESGVELFGEGRLRWETDAVKVMLMRPSYEPSQQLDRSRADVMPFEVDADASYPRGGVTLPSRAVVQGDAGDQRLTAGVVELDDMTAEVRFAVVYQANGGKPENDPLIAYSDLGLQRAENARFVLEYGPEGVCALLAPRIT